RRSGRRLLLDDRSGRAAFELCGADHGREARLEEMQLRLLDGLGQDRGDRDARRRRRRRRVLGQDERNDGILFGLGPRGRVLAFDLELQDLGIPRLLVLLLVFLLVLLFILRVGLGILLVVLGLFLLLFLRVIRGEVGLEARGFRGLLGFFE